MRGRNMKLRRSEVWRLQRQKTMNQQRGAPGQHLLDPPKRSDYFNEAINVPDFFSPLVLR